MCTGLIVCLVFLQDVNSDAVCMFIPALFESFVRANWLVSLHLGRHSLYRGKFLGLFMNSGFEAIRGTLMRPNCQN